MLRQENTRRFAQAPFRPVANDRIPDLLGGGKSSAGMRARTGPFTASRLHQKGFAPLGFSVTHIKKLRSHAKTGDLKFGFICFAGHGLLPPA
jgi:hypothetical protein